MSVSNFFVVHTTAQFRREASTHATHILLVKKILHLGDHVFFKTTEAYDLAALQCRLMALIKWRLGGD